MKKQISLEKISSLLLPTLSFDQVVAELTAYFTVHREANTCYCADRLGRIVLEVTNAGEYWFALIQILSRCEIITQATAPAYLKAFLEGMHNSLIFVI